MIKSPIREQMQVTLETGDFTIEAWFNTDTTGATDAALFSNWDSGNNRSNLDLMQAAMAILHLYSTPLVVEVGQQ